MERTYTYRSDGRPLCPNCGADALFDVIIHGVKTAPWATDPQTTLQCGACRWLGTVPKRQNPSIAASEGGK